MAQYQVLYWKDLPSLVRSEDLSGEVQVPMGARFDHMIDRRAMREGLEGGDEYLDAFHWGEVLEKEGTAQSVAARVKEELEAQFPPA